MKKSNRRRAKRLKIDRTVKVPVHLFPVMPFIGKPAQAKLVNISSGGMALVVDEPVNRSHKFKVHFHFPGKSIQTTQARVTHCFVGHIGDFVLGVRFLKPSKSLVKNIQKMVTDSANCDQRISESSNPQCEKACSFFQLCRKPIRLPHHSSQPHLFEIAFQNLDETLAA